MEKNELIEKLNEMDLLDDHLFKDKALIDIDAFNKLMKAIYEIKPKSIKVSHIPESVMFEQHIEEYLDYAKYEFCKDNREILLMTIILPKKTLSKIRKDLNLKK